MYNNFFNDVSVIVIASTSRESYEGLKIFIIFNNQANDSSVIYL